MPQECPVRHTCPDIDAVIREVKSSLQTAKAIKDKVANTDEQKMSPDMWVTFKESIEDEADEIENYLASVEGQLEDLRTANEKLREWGLDLYNEVEELEDKVGTLETDVYEITEELDEERNSGADL